MASLVSPYCLLVLCCFMHQVALSRPKLERSYRSHTQVGSFCSRTCKQPDDQLNDKDFPLYQCSCSPSCAVYGDCCFDSPHKSITMWRNRNFVCLSVVGHGRYKAVSSCPSDQAGDFCRDGLGHLPPVTSRVTNTTYANVFCANCNGDKEDLITWKVELRCSSDGNTCNETKYIFQSGNIWSLNEADRAKGLCKYHIHNNDLSFMEGLELRPCTANIRKIYRCSSSWGDISVLQMCRSYEDPVYFRNTAFRNAHCAQCNYLNPEFADCIPSHVKNVLEAGVVDLKVKKFCKTRGFDACIHSLSDKSKGRPYALADLLNINERSCVPPSGRKCCTGHAFDFRSKRCRKTRD